LMVSFFGPAGKIYFLTRKNMIFSCTCGFIIV
jgi:hypothetical protein